MAFIEDLVEETITQVSGTIDEDLSGLQALSLVSFTVLGDKITYDLSTVKGLFIYGELTIANEVNEHLAISGELSCIIAYSGSILQVGAKKDSVKDYLSDPLRGREVLSEPIDLNGTGGLREASTSFIRVDDGATFKAYNRTINSYSGIGIDNLATSEIESCTLIGSRYYWYNPYILKNSVMYGQFFVVSSPTEFLGNSFINDFYVAPSSSSPSGEYELRNVPDLEEGQSLLAFGSTSTNFDDVTINVINGENGSDYLNQILATDNFVSQRRYFLVFWKELFLISQDEDKNNISDVKYYIEGGQNLTPYTLEDDGTGVSQVVRLREDKMESTGLSNEFFSLEGSGTDLYNIKVFSYLYDGINLPLKALKGIDLETIVFEQKESELVTNTNTSEVLSYTEFNDAYKAYDAARLYHYNNKIESDFETSRVGTKFIDLNKNIVLDSLATGYSETTDSTTMNSSNFSGGIDAIQVELMNDSTISNGDYGTVILTNPNANYVFDNVTIENLENKTGGDLLITSNNSSIINLIETDGTISIPKTLTVSDSSGDSFCLVVVDAIERNVIYARTDATEHTIDVSDYSAVGITYYKKGHWVDSETVVTSESVEKSISLRSVPFYDSRDVDYIKNNLSTEVVYNPYVGILALIEAEFNTAFDKVLPQGDMREVILDLHGESPFIELIAQIGRNGDDLIGSDENGFSIIQPVVHFSPSGNFNVLSNDYVNDQGSIFVTDNGTIDDYIHNPENSDNRSFQGTREPTIFSSTIGIDENIDLKEVADNAKQAAKFSENNYRVLDS